MLDALPDLQLPAFNAEFRDAIADIVCNVRVGSDLSIYHTQHLSSCRPIENRAKFDALAPHLQQQYLEVELREFIYKIYFRGQPDNLQSSEESASEIESGLDSAFGQELHRANSGGGYLDRGWVVVGQPQRDRFVVRKGGLTLSIDGDRHLQSPSDLVRIGDIVTIRLPRNRLEDGYYVAVGDAGWDYPSDAIGIYFHIDAEGAIALMAAITRRFNSWHLPFTFRVLYTPSEYRCYDAGILHLRSRHYRPLRPLLEEIYTAHRAYFQEPTPLFARRLAPGLGLAEEPDGINARPKTFGLHRCQLVAKGLLAARHQREDSPTARLSAIQHQFHLQGLDWRQPHCNPHSQEVYEALDLSV